MAQTDKDNRPDKDSPVVKNVTILVMGEAAPRETYPKKTSFEKASEQALKATGNTVDLTKWVLTDAAGGRLQFDQTFGSANIQDDATLRLDRKQGAQA